MLALLLGALMSRWCVAAGDTSVASIHLSGLVPVYFSVTTADMSTFLDLTPHVIVTNRSVALVHFKYNENVQTITVSSSTLSGKPENTSSQPYSFGGGGNFQVGFQTGCQTVDPTYNTAFVLTNTGTDVHSALSANLVTQGIEEDCTLFVSYLGTTINLPLAGLYSIDVNITMVAP